jgi:hypothetical protein
MDGDFEVDLSEIAAALRASDVASLYFPFLRKSLLLDFRRSETEGPLVRLLPQVDTAEQRLESIRKLRPRFGEPERLSLIAWPKLIGSLVRLGVWDAVLERCRATGSREMLGRCERCLETLRRVERDFCRNAIIGKNFETLWPAPPRRG